MVDGGGGLWMPSTKMYNNQTEGRTMQAEEMTKAQQWESMVCENVVVRIFSGKDHITLSDKDYFQSYAGK